MTQFIYKTKTLISIYHLSIVYHLKWFPKCIESYWLMVFKAKKKNDFQKLKTFKRWVPMNFHWAKRIVMDGFPWSLGTETTNPSSWKCLSNEALYKFESQTRRDHILICTTCHFINLNFDTYLVQRDVVFQTIPKLAWWLEDNKNNHVHLIKQFQ